MMMITIVVVMVVVVMVVVVMIVLIQRIPKRTCARCQGSNDYFSNSTDLPVNGNSTEILRDLSPQDDVSLIPKIFVQRL